MFHQIMVQQKITASVTQFLSDNNISTDKFVAVGCDGTNVNTGRSGGVIWLLEEHYKRPLQWLVCQLHANELPLRHLLHHWDSSITGPKAFAGPVGNMLPTCDKMPVVEYEKIEATLPEVNLPELSTDQQYLWEITNAVSTGICSMDLSKRDPETLNHSRWLTTANRILRLYVANDQPSSSLKVLAEYIAKVYAPMWFNIKTKPFCKDEAKHLWRTILLSRYLEKPLLDVIDTVIQRNAYFDHAENILHGMLTDERKHIRELGLRRIVKARRHKASDVRQFTIPKLNTVNAQNTMK